jgi:hypothetical protein
MTTALVVNSVPTLIVYGASLVLVMWAMYDVARRPRNVLPPKRKAAWAFGTIVGWLVFGIVGAFIAVVYLVGPRRRMDAARWN